jgi:2-polyprenyl-6-methoxyphenol hydroxylase-like FAD-dependent oxidoreductase
MTHEVARFARCGPQRAVRSVNWHTLPLLEGSPVNHRHAHAVVLGASLAGLVHAIPLATRFDRVTLVDRDILPPGAEHRGGVPQGHHVHLLVPGGVERMEALLPGAVDEIASRGGYVIPAPEWRFNMGGGQLPLDDGNLRVAGATRPLLEAVVRDRVLAMEGVELLEGWTARELTANDDRTHVTGVQLRSSADPDEHLTLNADLVIDTTGRGSPSPRWLTTLGYESPAEERLQVDVHYATRLFRRDPGDLGGCRHVLIDVPPDGRRGGVALAVEDDRWQVTLIGMLGERPPTELHAFTQYAASLWSDDLHTIVDGATPLDDGSPRAFPSFSWHRYDQLASLPQRYVISGDAVCSFDPRFGQGMTVAMAEAIVLGETLDHHGLDDIGRRVLSASQPVVQDAWDLATGADLAHPEVEGPRPLAWKLTTAYMQRLLPVAHREPEVAAALIRVIGMIDRPQQLMSPRTLWRVLRDDKTPHSAYVKTHATTRP